MPSQNKERATNNSLEKALSLLDYFSPENPTRGLSELSRLSGFPKATTYRMITSFEQHGYLRKVDTIGKQNQYALGIRFLLLGTVVSDTLELKDVALPFMIQLRDRLNEDVQLVMRDQDKAVYIEKIGCDHPVRLYTRIGRSAALYAGACPRAILSFLPDTEVQELLDSATFIPYTNSTLVTKESVWASIKASRKHGYTLSYGELEPDTCAVGAPIYNHEGIVIASISTAGPVQRFNDERLPQIIEATIETTRNISKALGYTG